MNNKKTKKKLIVIIIRLLVFSSIIKAYYNFKNDNIFADGIYINYH